MILPKDGIVNKILLTVIGTLFISFLGWGTWVTVVTFDLEDVVACAAENKQKITKKADVLQRQINTRFNKSDAQFIRQDAKLDAIMMKLMSMSKPKEK